MASINGGGNPTQVNPWSGKGLSGLASGMDTESIVQAMLQGTQAKIDRQNQKLQTLEWRQAIYRDVITRMHTFQNKYFSYTSNTNIMSNAFWNAAKVASSNSAVSVTKSGSNANTNISIDAIKELATATKQEGVSGISGDINLSLEGIKNWPTKVVQDVDGKDVTVFDSVEFQVSLDGVSKNIKVSLDGLATTATDDEKKKKFEESLNDALDNVFGSGVKAELTNGSLSIKTFNQDGTEAKNHSLKLTAKTQEARDILGMKGDTVSNKISLSTRLGDLPLGTKLNGDVFGFKINGVVIEATSNDTLSSLISKVNKSDAGVTMSYNSLKDRIELTANNTGAGVKIDVEDVGGNLMNALMGAKGSGSVASNKLTSKISNITGGNNLDTEFKAISEDSPKTFKITIDGKEKEYTVKKADTKEELIKNLNDQIKKDFNGVSLEENENGNVVLNAGGKKVSFADAEVGSLNEMFGFAKEDNFVEVTADTKLSDLEGFKANSDGTYSINGQVLAADAKISDVINAIGGDAEFKDGRILFTGADGFTLSDTGESNVIQNLFNSSSITIDTDASDKLPEQIKGTNAKLIINGEEVERNSNTFELDGMNITLNETYNATKNEDGSFTIGNEGPINITSTRDNEKIMDTLKDFVKDYNEMIKVVRGLTSESAKELKKYPPLTDAQKKEMTSKEIELWEEKAKKGLLNGDSLLTSMESQFRGLLYKKASEDGIALYDMGITTNKDGTLKIDEDRLKSTIETNIDGIKELFTTPETGLAVQMNKMVDRFAKASTGSPGLLVQKAGVKDTATESQNTINRQMKDVQDFIKRLQSTYDMQKTRYWKQLSSLESIVANSNSTSAWLADAFA